MHILPFFLGSEVTNRAQWQLCVDYTIFPTTYKQETFRGHSESKEKAALWAAEPLVVGFSCEVEALSRDFAVALDEELAHAKRDEVFVNLYLNGLMLTCALYGEA